MLLLAANASLVLPWTFNQTNEDLRSSLLDLSAAHTTLSIDYPPVTTDQVRG